MSNRNLDPYPEESNLPVALWIVPLVAVVVIPGLFWTVAERPMAMRYELAIWATVGVGIFATVLLGILSSGLQRRLRWSLSVTAVATLVVFQWPFLAFAGRDVAAKLSMPFLTDATPVLLAVALLWLATRNGGEWQFTAVIGAATVAIVVVLISGVLPMVELGDASDRGQAASDAPDVLLLVLDGYLRADILQDQLEFDNTQFLEELEALGFTVAEQAQANYGYTFASLSTMLNLDYVYDLGTITDEDNKVMRNAMSGNPPMMDLFRQAGYEVALLENAWEGSHCGAAVDICIRDGLTERVLWRLGQVTILAPVLRAVRPNPFNSVSFAHLESLESHMLDGRTEGIPRLTFAHVVMPHPPFLRDAECNYHNTPARHSFAAANESQIDLRRQFYREQLTCTNQHVIDAIRSIVTERPDTIVMISGDHGSATSRVTGADLDIWTYDSLVERISILSAYRVPGCEQQAYPTITPVNGTRLITNCAIDAGLSSVPDQSMWAPPEGGAEVVNMGTKLADSLVASSK